MKELHTEIEIDAEPAAVWAVLTDTDRYGDWNPFVPELRGELAVGGRLHVRLKPPNSRGATLRPTVTALAPCETLEWLGTLGVRGIFDGRHRFELHRTPTGTRFVQREQFTGILVPLLGRWLDGGTRAGFVAMNEALKARAEASVAAGH